MWLTVKLSRWNNVKFIALDACFNSRLESRFSSIDKHIKRVALCYCNVITNRHDIQTDDQV